MKIKHLFVSILLATGFQPMIAQSALFYFPPETNLCNRFHRKR